MLSLRGVRSTILSRTSPGIDFTISVPIKPGATALTRMLYLPNSRAPGACHTDDPGLRRDVIRLPEITIEPHDRCRAHDGAASAIGY